MSCFGPERHHRLFKTIASFSYSACGQTALAYDVRTWVRALYEEHVYMPIHLAGKTRSCNVNVDWPGCCIQTFTSCAASLACTSGRLHKKDLLQYKSGRYDSVCIAIGFLRNSTQQEGPEFVAAAHPCAQAGNMSNWMPDYSRLILVAADSIVGAVPHCTLPCGTIVALLHPDP